MEAHRITPAESPIIAAVLKKISDEIGAAAAQASGIGGPEAESIHATFSTPGAIYFVLTHEGQVYGGVGLAPLGPSNKGICDLRQFGLLPEGRGRKWGLSLFNFVVGAAKALEYSHIYVETHSSLTKGVALLRKVGCQPLPQPPAGHSSRRGADVRLLYQL